MKIPVRMLARSGAALVAVTVVVLVAVQFVRIGGKNVAYARELSDVRSEIAGLEDRRIEQLREIKRLSDPQGAIPEIHDRLHVVGDREAIIYVKRPGD